MKWIKKVVFSLTALTLAFKKLKVLVKKNRVT